MERVVQEAQDHFSIERAQIDPVVKRGETRAGQAQLPQAGDVRTTPLLLDGHTDLLVALFPQDPIFEDDGLQIGAGSGLPLFELLQGRAQRLAPLHPAVAPRFGAWRGHQHEAEAEDDAKELGADHGLHLRDARPPRST